MFVLCFFGKIASESFEKMTDYLYETNWPEYPVQLQKYFILLIANTQKPIHYVGSGIAVLNLNTFLKVYNLLKKNRKILVQMVFF